MRGIPEDKALFIIEDLHAFGTADGAERLRNAIVDLKETLRPMSTAPGMGSILVKFKFKNALCEGKIDGDFIRVIGGARGLSEAEGWVSMPEVDHD